MSEITVSGGPIFGGTLVASTKAADIADVHLVLAPITVGEDEQIVVAEPERATTTVVKQSTYVVDVERFRICRTVKTSE